MLYPLRMTPIYQTAIWGGRKLETFLGRKLPEGDSFAESWDVSSHPRGVNIVQNGPLAGQSIQNIFDNYREELLGPHANSKLARFPLMVKFLDANRQLSVQVHPNEEYVKKNNLSDSAKSEAWVVLQVAPGSQLTLGFQHPVTREDVENALKNDELESILFKREPLNGECYFLPAGTVHSLGAGIFLYEIQQCSDLTFRLYDWNREDAHGKKRELHVRQALESLKPELWNSGPITPQLLGEGRELLVESQTFCLERLTFGETDCVDEKGQKPGPAQNQHWVNTSRSCHVLTVIRGELKVEGLESPMLQGESVILPASLGKIKLSSVSAVVLAAYLPEGDFQP